MPKPAFFSDLDAPVGPEAGAVVRFDGASLRYGRDPEVLKNVSLSLAPGSFHFLTGPSGAGKSSLLRLIYLAQKPSQGRVWVFGRDAGKVTARERPALRRRIGVVFQDYRLLDHLSAFDNVALPLRVAGERPAEYREDVEELLTWVGLKHRLWALPPALSGGEKQRLAIARAVVRRPDLLIADEPTGNVDGAMARRLMRLFAELNRAGTTVLMATHDEQVVEELGYPQLRLEGGALVGTTEDKR